MLDERSEAAATCDPVAMDVRAGETARSGDAARAGTAFRSDEARPTAAPFDVAVLLREQRGGRAIAALRRAVRPGHVPPEFTLGSRVAESADPSALIKLYRITARCGDRGDAYQLGLLYLDRGDLGSARSAFARADDLGHPWAALALGEILRRGGDHGGATAAYRRAADCGVAAARACLDAPPARRGVRTASTAAAPRPAGRSGLAGSAKPWASRRLAWTAGAAAAFGALLIVSLLTLLPTAATKPPPSVQSTRAMARPPAPATRAAAGGVRAHPRRAGKRPASRSPTTSFTARQSALLASVPGAAHAQCLPRAEERLPRAGASIRCFSASAGVTALYYRYSSRPLLRRVFHNYRAWFAARHKLRDCAGLTHGKYYQGSSDSTIAGRWACFHNDRVVPGRACIDWADYDLLIFGSACQADGNFTTLARWWRHAGPVPASTPGLTNRYS